MTAVFGGHTLSFSARTGVRSMNEGYDRMTSGKARFRVVLTMGA